MSHSTLPPALSRGSGEPGGLYRVGTLTYTKRGLAVLFFWLLWGDVCFTLMENVIPSILPLKFEKLGASNVVISLILSTIPMIINSCTNPIISFKSDRFRSRWGRRIPFIVVTMPPLVLFMLGVGFGDSLGYWLHGHVAQLSSRFSPNAVALTVIGTMMALFWLMNMFVASVFWYLFNDVVPEQLLARFMSWFRSVSVGAIALYNFFVFRYAESHASEIFVGTAVLYLVGFGVMCFNVKEGHYPPPPAYDKGGAGPVAAIRTYAKECHTKSHWLYVFLIAIGMGGIIVSGNFMIFFYKKTGLDVEHIGNVQGVGNLSMFFMILVSGWLADRFHPIRVVIIGLVLQALVATPASLLWLFWQPDPQTSYYLWLGITIGLMSPAGALVGILDPVLFMRIFPRSRYGQFCSANALWRSLSIIFGGILLGAILDAIKARYDERTSYVSLPFWQLGSYLLMLFATLKLYGTWKRYGGDAGYIAPGDEEFVGMRTGGFEVIPATNPGAGVAPVPNVPQA